MKTLRKYERSCSLNSMLAAAAAAKTVAEKKSQLKALRLRLMHYQGKTVKVRLRNQQPTEPSVLCCVTAEGRFMRLSENEDMTQLEVGLSQVFLIKVGYSAFNLTMASISGNEWTHPSCQPANLIGRHIRVGRRDTGICEMIFDEGGKRYLVFQNQVAPIIRDVANFTPIWTAPLESNLVSVATAQ